MKKTPKISVVIVNYNVKDFLEQALISVKRALSNIDSEIMVVDNNSVDGSVQMMKRKFGDIQLIESEKNLGFSAGNNLALKKAAGEFIVLLNPDTVVQEDTFVKLLAFFDKTPKASAATCKILNPDGSFSIDCRHSVPTPLTAFWKIIGLASLFPKNKAFGKYNLTYLNENETYPVEAISGSFMMIKREMIQKVGLLDESFFMYCEDIDYCHRINKAGGKIYYVPDSQIVHYKGESSKKNHLDYVITFNKSLYQFYKKHYQQKYIYPFKWLILLGVILRGITIIAKNTIKLYYPFLFDIIILNWVLFFSFYIRYEMTGGFRIEDFWNEYIVINLIASAAYFITAMFFENLKKDSFSIARLIRSVFTTFVFVSALTFFFKQFAFSRSIVLVAAALSGSFMIFWRVVSRALGRTRKASILGKDFFLKNTLIVGFDEEAKNILSKLQDKIDSGLKVAGIVSLKPKDVGKEYQNAQVVTHLEKLHDFVKMKRPDLIIFSTHNIPYKRVLEAMAKIRDNRIEFKMVPGNLEVMIGKSTVEPLDEIPLVDIEYAYDKLFNKFIKRSFDLILSIVLLALFFIPTLPFLFGRKKIQKKTVYTTSEKTLRLLYSDSSKILNLYLKIFQIFISKISFVGSEICENKSQTSIFDYKPGISGPAYVNAINIKTEQDKENYELHYLKNHNLFLDLDILGRSIKMGNAGKNTLQK
jgi:GT2 family glycosyltransferase/lipopolysaccharide/colanic/teichoic acid biosynthesis glycosyltransferase